MFEAQIKIRVKSMVLLGSGQGHGSLIDADIVSDSHGLPCFPARRLKGLLRESATEVIEMLGEHISEFKFMSIDDVFGTGANPARVRFYNACLAEYDAASDWLKWAFNKFPALFTAETVLNTITEVRMQTAVNPQGIADDNSLRSARVLRPGFTFEAGVALNLENGLVLKLLALAAANLRHIGSNRNRGLGEVECSLWYNKKNLSQSIIDEIKVGV